MPERGKKSPARQPVEKTRPIMAIDGTNPRVLDARKNVVQIEQAP